eukprot:TRINITY_DN121793_c0_g1_i1.p1 TRINITY_DN121793_c0_g1~~TRINITY_DN121793_c0_g1_i1.p1  ORF type:complete len:105 (-),score=10.13 TRINITY_DN121793_c0_g1_i1:440-754(-)
MFFELCLWSSALPARFVKAMLASPRSPTWCCQCICWCCFFLLQAVMATPELSEDEKAYRKRTGIFIMCSILPPLVVLITGIYIWDQCVVPRQVRRESEKILENK